MASSNRKTKKTSSSKSRSTKRSSDSAISRFFASAFWGTSLGKSIKLIVAVLIVFLLNLLISRNNYSTYYLLLGIELLIAFIVLIGRLIWQQKNLED